MLRITIVILLIANFQFCFAQEIIPGMDEYIKHAQIDRNVQKPVDYKYVQGSCYLNELFIDGRMILNNVSFGYKHQIVSNLKTVLI